MGVSEVLLSSVPISLSVQCNTLHGTEYKITCGVCLCVFLCVCVRALGLGLNISKAVTDRGSVTMGH